MREAMGGIPIVEVVILFILLFTGVMCLTINHSKAYAVKDEIINVIENQEYGSLTSTSFALSEDVRKKDIAELLNNAGYRLTGKCPTGYTGYKRDGSEDPRGNDSSYCIKINKADDIFLADSKEKCKNNKCKVTTNDYPAMVYYDVVVFYQLDIPLFSDAFSFKLTGSTKVLFGTVTR